MRAESKCSMTSHTHALYIPDRGGFRNNTLQGNTHDVPFDDTAMSKGEKDLVSTDTTSDHAGRLPEEKNMFGIRNTLLSTKAIPGL